MITSKKNFLKHLLLLLICLLGISIYSNTFHSPFQFDDDIFIATNPKIQNIHHLKPLWEDWSYRKRFVAFTSFALNYYFHHQHVFGYHLVNVLIHLMNTLLVYWLINLILSSPAMKNCFSSTKDHHKNLIAVFTALLFLSHPVQTGAVTYISQRFTSMAGLFYLLSLCLYIQSRTSTRKKTIRILYASGACISAGLGIFTKEIVLTLPITIVVIEWLFLSEKTDGDERLLEKGRYKRWLVPAILSGLMLLFVTRILFSTNLWDILKQHSSITSYRYLLTQFRVIITYLQLLVFPINQNLDYDYPLSQGFFTGPTFGSFWFLLLLFSAAIKLIHRHRLISFGIFWFFITLSIESSIIPISDVIFEHRLYLPLIGFAVCLSYGLYHSLKNIKIYVLLFCLIVGLLSCLTYRRNEVWRDQETLWNDVIRKSPRKARPYNILGFHYYKKKQYDSTISTFDRIISILPDHAPVYVKRGAAYAAKGEHTQAFADYNRALLLNPDLEDAYLNRGALYEKSGEYKKAIADYNQILKRSPYSIMAFYNRANAYMLQGQYEQALDDYQTTLTLNPYFAEAHVNRGMIYQQLNQHDKAINDFNKALGINPQLANAYHNRGVSLCYLKKYRDAIHDFNKAMHFDFKTPVVYLSRGLAYMELNDDKSALDDFNQALILAPASGMAYYLRSKIYYRNADLAEALQNALTAQRLNYPVEDVYLNQLKEEVSGQMIH